ncbi:hypothetical protein OSTOST_09175 [Ostertagia ostertagi]
MSRRSNTDSITNSEVDPEDSFNDSVHFNDSWFYGPPKKKQVLSNDTQENNPSPIRTKRASLVEKSLGELETFPKQRLALAKLEEHAKVFKNTRVFSFEMPGHSDCVQVRTKRASLVEKSLGELETFPKQRLALAKLEEHAKVFKNTRVFSFEMPGHSEGERRYLVSTLERFWSWYSTLSERHLYELIAESSPCRLYFDLEYSKETNPDIDHEVVYRHFMETVQRLLKSEFDLDVDPFKVLHH